MQLASRMDVVQARNPPEGFPLLPSPMDLCSLPGSVVPWSRWRKLELTARKGGKRCYVSSQKKGGWLAM